MFGMRRPRDHIRNLSFKEPGGIKNVQRKKKIKFKKRI